jgi:predicted nucleic acid-binding protein
MFLSDLDEGVWAELPLNDLLLRSVEALTRSLPASCFLRAGDAVHLATAKEHGFREIWTNDRHLKAAAAHVGMEARSVLLEQ